MKELDHSRMGMRIRQVRKAKGWSQGSLQKSAGSVCRFSDILSGGRGS